LPGRRLLSEAFGGVGGVTVEEETVAEVGQMLDTYVAGLTLAKYMHVESDPGEVPAAMWTGEVFETIGVKPRRFANAQELLAAMREEDGFEVAWVGWRMLPSAVTAADVAAVEEEFGIRFPPLYRAYLRARAHLLEGFTSRRHGESIGLPSVPFDRPLEPLRKLLRDWGQVIPAGFIPCGTYGDEEWGGLFFDAGRRGADGDCPVVLIDHEVGVSLGEEGAGQRAAIEQHVEPLYESCRELLADYLLRAEPGAAPDPAGR
jgi:hypothetical protein